MLTGRTGSGARASKNDECWRVNRRFIIYSRWLKKVLGTSMFDNWRVMIGQLCLYQNDQLGTRNYGLHSYPRRMSQSKRTNAFARPLRSGLETTTACARRHNFTREKQVKRSQSTWPVRSPHPRSPLAPRRSAASRRRSRIRFTCTKSSSRCTRIPASPPRPCPS